MDFFLSLLKNNLQFECYMKTFLYYIHLFSFQAPLVEIALSLFNCFVLFCFVFKHITKQEEAHVLPANRVFWVLVLPAPAFPPLNQVNQLRKTKRVRFLNVFSAGQRPYLTGNRCSRRTYKSGGNCGGRQQLASSSERKVSWNSYLKGHLVFCSEGSMTIGTKP